MSRATTTVGLDLRGRGVRRPLVALLVTANLVAASAARADDATGVATSPSRPAWYGGQTLVLDAAVLGLAAGGAGVMMSDASRGTRLGVGLPLLLSGALGDVLASPILHAVHGHPVDPREDPTMKNAAYARTTGLFLGLAVALLGGLAIAGGIGDRPPSYSQPPAVTIFPIVSIALGITIPIALDVSLWTFEPKPRREPTAPVAR